MFMYIELASLAQLLAPVELARSASYLRVHNHGSNAWLVECMKV